MASVEIKSLKELETYIQDGYSILDCYGDFCSACVLLEPVLQAAISEMSCIHFAKVNISQYNEFAEKFNINAMPTLLFFKDGKEVHRVCGSMDREMLNQHISTMLYQ